MLKKILLPFYCVSLFIQQNTANAAGPVVVGNGGDVHEENPVTVPYLFNLLNDSKLFITMWVNGLDGKLQHDYKTDPKQVIPVPKASAKLIMAFRSVNQPKIVFRTKSPCMSSKGPADGSVLSENPAEICISGFTMAKKLNEGNAKIQLEALIVHEISHLRGATEQEAIELQSQYLKDMQFVSKESILKYTGNLQTNLWSFQNTLPNLITKLDDFRALQSTLSAEVDRVQAIAARSDITGLSAYDVRHRDQADNLFINFVYILQSYIWRDFGTDPAESLAHYTKGFKGTRSVEVKEWLINSGHNFVHMTTYQYTVNRIETKDDYVNEILRLFGEASELKSQVQSVSKAKFELAMDDQ